jgi:hypothetical protein
MNVAFAPRRARRIVRGQIWPLLTAAPVSVGHVRYAGQRLAGGLSSGAGGASMAWDDDLLDYPQGACQHTSTQHSPLAEAATLALPSTG